MKITILYGTETGNAEMLAEDIQSELESSHDVDCVNLSEFEPGAFDSQRFYLLICSTYGDGELPISAKPFAEKLTAGKPDLSAIRFAIFGMGDSEYEETFNFGPKALAELMQGCGAVQIGARVAHDASGPDMAEDIAYPWAEAVIAEAAEAIGEAA